MTREQFTQMVVRQQEGLRRFLLALCCGRADDASDIAQDAFIKAYIARSQYDERGQDAVWLRRIAYTTFINHTRKRQRERTDQLTADTPSPHTSDDTFRYQPLYDALATLTEAERTSIVLHYIEGYKVGEIAEITAQSEAAVKKQLQRGREQLKRRIQL